MTLMKIAIIGTRGIPNNYGGFEQFAEYLSVGLVKKGHDVTVYNSDKHSFQEKNFNGVQIIHQKDPENKLGTIGQFIYDFNCILDARKHNFDIILNLGYTSSSIWGRFFPKNSIVITNMDGLEWKRTKFSKPVQKFLLYAEKLAVKFSDELVADSEAIQSYIFNKYQVSSKFIAYGADLFENPQPEVLKTYNLSENKYNMLIARMEPENNIETILDGVHLSNCSDDFIVVGNPSNKFGCYLQEKYKSDTRIRFVGPIYDISILNNLRYYSKFYFHGHSVGGTNPSLLEAMACSSLIVAHNNPFNESVLRENAIYFTSAKDIQELLNNNMMQDENQKHEIVTKNRLRLKQFYSWEYIINEYESYMLGLLS